MKLQISILLGCCILLSILNGSAAQYCNGRCVNQESIPLVEVFHGETFYPSNPPETRKGWMWDIHLTAAKAAAAGWTVPSTAACIPRVGRVAYKTADPSYPLALRFDNQGNLAGLRLLATFAMNKPATFCPNDVGVCAWPGLVTAPPILFHSILDLWLRNPDKICSATDGGGLVLTNLYFGSDAQYEMAITYENSMVLGMYDTLICVPEIGIHYV